jgi:hypothetical protein
VRFSIVSVEDYLRAELVGRKTAEETREFLEALAGATLEHAILKVLICVYSSLSIFKVEQYGASGYLKRLAARPGSLGQTNRRRFGASGAANSVWGALA